jgi:H+/Cl- antiporter ClcA
LVHRGVRAGLGRPLGGPFSALYVQPQKRPLGVADVIEAKQTPETSLRFWPGIGSAIVSATSLGFGASTGREGPVVHLGATIAASISRLFKLPRSSNRVLLACGVAGAVSASFNAPIAGVLFAHEVILGHYALSAFSAIVIASGAATIISRLYFGDAVAFTIPDYQITSFFRVSCFRAAGPGLRAGGGALPVCADRHRLCGAHGDRADMAAPSSWWPCRGHSSRVWFPQVSRRRLSGHRPWRCATNCRSI